MLLQPQLMSLKCSCGRCCDRRRVSGHFSSCKAGAEDAARVRECSEAKVECGTGSGTATMTQSEQSERWIDAHEEYIHQHKSEGAQTDRQSLHTHKWFHVSRIYTREIRSHPHRSYGLQIECRSTTFHLRTDRTPHPVVSSICKCMTQREWRLPHTKTAESRRPLKLASEQALDGIMRACMFFEGFWQPELHCRW